ncbi:hypothetical protein ACWCOP_12790 [Maricaulaceae bacterium MS644]
MADDHAPSVSPEYFIKKWGPSKLKERSAAQEHFLDLCHLLGEPTPAEIDPKGEFYCFERGAADLLPVFSATEKWKILV